MTHRDNHQEGSIPVALTLQQLHTSLWSSHSNSLLLPNLELEPITARIEPCETDIFIATEDGDNIVLAVGECKDEGGSITEEDARKLAAVSDALSARGFYCYIIFSKTAPFTTEDIENCRRANDKGRTRVIMLSDRELEPYHIYEKTSAQSEIRGGHSLHDMALSTVDIYLKPRLKDKNAPAGK
jgi:hypothetical protein